MKEKYLIGLTLLIFVVFFSVVFRMNSHKKEVMHNKFQEAEFSSRVVRVEFKGKFDRIYLNDGTVFDYVIESWEKEMAQYENVHLETIIMKNDSVVKRKNEFKIHIFPAPNEKGFELIGKGEIIR